MKKSTNLFCLIFCILSFIPFSKAQDYVPFLDKRKTWNILHDSWWAKTTHEYFLDETVVFNDTVYYQLQAKWLTDNNLIKNNQITFFVFIREDTIAKRVYFRHHESFNEYLLYDFNLKRGDTTIVSNYYDTSNNHFFFVHDIDTISLLNGEKRKRWIMYEVNYGQSKKDIWIEGIGSTRGVIYPGEMEDVVFNLSTELLCFFFDGKRLFHHPIYDCIYTWGVNVNEHNVSQIIISPNPVTGFIFIQAANSLIEQNIIISSMDGIVRYKGKLKDNLYIDIQHFTPGFYNIVIFSDGKSEFITSKILKI